MTAARALLAAVATTAVAAGQAAPAGPALSNVMEVLLDAVVQPVGGTGTDSRLLLLAEIGHFGRPVKSVGYEIVAGDGRIAAQAIDTPPVLRYVDDRRVMYTVPEPITPGRYTVTLTTADEDGRKGSAQHTVVVEAWTAGRPRMGEIQIGDAPKGTFRATPRVRPGADRLGARVEIHADASAIFEDADVEVIVLRVGDATGVVRQRTELLRASDPRQRTATAVLDIASLPPGEYEIVAVLRNAAGELARRVRAFVK